VFLIALTAIPSASISFSLALLLPFLGCILSGGTDIHLGMPAVAVLFAIFVLYMARTVHVSFMDKVCAQVANDRLVQDLESMQNDLLDAIKSTSEGFAIFDEDDRLRYYNDKQLDISGSMRDKIVPGILFAEIVRATSPPLQCEGRELGDKEWLEWRLRRHLKGAGSLQQQQSPGRWNFTTDRRTRQGGYVTVYMDIADMKEHETELAAARDDAESAKPECLTLMTHELRTPLNAVLGFSDNLKDESYGPHSDARFLEYSRDIHDGGSHLLPIINQILDLSKIEAGKYELMEEGFELEFPFNDVRQKMGQLAQDAGLTLSLECDRGIPGLCGDLHTIRQILINLIPNAIKFRPTGGIVTETASRQDPAEGDGLLIRISDTGVGIDEQDIIKALTPFGQIQGPVNGNHQGTGLGLLLVRSFMPLHEGGMSIDSALKQGTTINLYFSSHPLIERNAA
jgi:two-component system cell cycle sensor histidine kinase PleC